MEHIRKFTSLGFYLNSLIDKGEFIELEETRDHIENKSLFSWLKKKYEYSMDISLYTSEELNEIIVFFEGLSNTEDEEKTFGVSKNGLCFLLAYCLEGLQTKPSDFTAFTKNR